MRRGRGEATKAHRTLGSHPLRGPVQLAQVWEEVVTQAAKTPWVVRAVRAQGREMANRVVAQ